MTQLGHDGHIVRGQSQALGLEKWKCENEILSERDRKLDRSEGAFNFSMATDSKSMHVGLV